MSVEQKQYDLKFLTSGLIFGESPRWRNGILYISDMLGKKVYAIDAQGNKTVIAEVPSKPNGLGFLPNGDLIIGAMHETRLYRVTPNGLELYADLSEVYTGYIGDMVVDGHGRIYVDDVGARVFEGEALKPGRVVVIEPNGEVSVGVEDCTFPNGIVITADQKHLIFVETFDERLTIMDIVDGKLENRRVFLDMTTLYPSESDREHKRGCVDGISIDAEDGLWLSMLRAEAFIRVNSKGEVTDRIPMPGYECVASTLGGEDGKTLHLVATKVDGPNIFEAMVNLRTESTIFTTRVAVGKGVGRP
ncbi:SMP-30/gluconolactonase/LRE family protein [Pseudomonas sp.]|uniref:SMP-30/gluconolactonase/LRE family protein n=1 Tax=Pseudomonas sp. TaxID=306 RepID=UPI00262ADB5E|nr:SMP-30/gluconolactonase/LRE family protein [Pseudomonas sp.]